MAVGGLGTASEYAPLRTARSFVAQAHASVSARLQVFTLIAICISSLRLLARPPGPTPVFSKEPRIGCRFELINIMNLAHPVKTRELVEAVTSLVRAFGLDRPDQMPGGHSVSVTEAHALMDMQVAGPISQRELAAGLRLEKSTVSRLVRLMEGRGWVKRTTAAHDRRVMHVSLSDAGKAAVQDLAQARRAKFARILAAVPQEERVKVVEAVSALAEAAARDVTVAPDVSKGDWKKAGGVAGRRR